MRFKKLQTQMSVIYLEIVQLPRAVDLEQEKFAQGALEQKVLTFELGFSKLYKSVFWKRT